MKVTQEKLPDSQISLNIEVSGDASRSTYDKVVQKLARSSNIPGFRKGKVPRQILIQRIGTQRIKAAVLEELIQTSLAEAIEQESIDALGNYELRSKFDDLIQQYQPGQPLTFMAVVDVPPSVELVDYHNLQVKAEESVYDPQQVDDFLEQRRAEQADLVPVEDRPAQMGDIAIIDFQGKLTAEGEEGQPIEGGSAENFQVELAEGRLIAGMVEGVVGMNPEETKEVSVTFPEDYLKEDLAGKPAVFSITLKELKTKELPDLDDDFAEEASNGEYETLEALQESLAKQFQEKAENETKENINAAIVQALLEQNTLDLPETLIQDEVTQVLTQTLMQFQQMGIDVKQIVNSDTIPAMRKNARPEAIENLSKKLILAEIANKESLAPDETAIKEKMAEIEQQLSTREIDYNKLRTMVTEDLIAENSLNWLREKSQIELVPQGSLSESETESETESSSEASENTENIEA
ncbi:MAG: trigger factor [Xenococcaceae cyanobacterium MO_234.B1]|nr:trigger factor [Xenococcaceae cyanobacterium MO_234.B1]